MQNVVTVAPKAALYKLSDPIARGFDIREGRDRDYLKKATDKKPTGKLKGGKRP